MGGKDNYLWVGVFVLGSLLAAVVLVLQLAGGAASENPQGYRLIFDRDVSGLNTGGQVTYLGVTVGEVSRIRLVTEEQPAVEVVIQVQAGTPITTATYASLAYQGVTGVAIINLSDDPAIAAAPLPSDNRAPPTLSTRNTGIAALLAEGPLLGSKLGDLLDRSNEALGSDNLERLSATLANLQSISESLSNQRDQLANLPEATSRLIARADTLLLRVDALLSSMGPDLINASGNLERASGDLADLASTSADWLNRHEQTLDRTMTDGVGQLPELIAETRSSLDTLEKLMAGLERDPSRLLYRANTDDLRVQP